eukprot:352421-Chlamydomonas_euryale.AAC.37
MSHTGSWAVSSSLDCDACNMVLGAPGGDPAICAAAPARRQGKRSNAWQKKALWSRKRGQRHGVLRLPARCPACVLLSTAKRRARKCTGRPTARAPLTRFLSWGVCVGRPTTWIALLLEALHLGPTRRNAR